MQELNIDEMEQEVLSGNVIVEFGADWCGPCKSIRPLLNEMSKDHKIITIDIDKEDPAKLAEYGIRSVPTMLAYKNGKVVNRLVGMQTKNSLRAIFDKK